MHLMLPFILSLSYAVCEFAYIADEKEKMFVEECKKLENPTDKDVERFLNHKPLYDLNSRCFLACIFDKAGLINTDGTIQAEVLEKTVLKEHKGNGNVKDPIHKIIAECQVIIHRNRCALASQLKDCLDKSSIYHGKFESDHGILV